jgi:hypothetical protein
MHVHAGDAWPHNCIYIRVTNGNGLFQSSRFSCAQIDTDR